MKNININTELFKLLSDESQMAILAFDEKHTLVYANQMAKDILEFPLESTDIDFKLSSIYPKEKSLQRMRCMNEETLEMQGLIQEIVLCKLNGQNFVATLAVKHIAFEQHKYLALTFQDVTLQKKMQREIMEKQNAIHLAYQELLMQNQQLKDLDVAKNRFIAMTTHELRTPLSAMTASAEILHLKIYDTTEQHDEFVLMIYEQGQHMLNLVNDILDYAKIQANKMDYYIELKNPYDLVETDVHGLLSMAEQAHVSMNISDRPTGDLNCYFDGVRLRQVISNLVNNAIKYNKNGGTVLVWLENKDQSIEVHIQDTGKGIATEDQNKVFNEFETLGKTANHSKGTGLGLPISKKMIESMGGSLHLESEEGKGSHFWITIPKNKVLTEDNYRCRPDQSDDLAA